jgi:uncharacterized protein involved in oxidation of intracellular sulfur
MKKLIFLLFILLSLNIKAQTSTISPCESVTAFNKSSNPDIGIIIFSSDAETVYNALRLAIYSQSKGDSVVIFVTGKGLDAYMKENDPNGTFNVQALSDRFLAKGGSIYACATCAKSRHTEEVKSCTITSIADMYEIIRKSKKVISF